MKAIVILLCVIVGSLAIPSFKEAESCKQEDNCVAAEGCRCAAKKSPLSPEETPQFVTLAYNDAVTDGIFNQYLQPHLFHRTNPDGTRIGVTFFVPHEYTDYEKVNALYNLGFEIAVHTITKSPLSSYWQEADVQLLFDEFYGQRQIISTFANVPMDDVVGARTPNLEINGDITFDAYQQAGIQYDNSWTAHSNNRYFPYSLHCLSDQPCLIGKCPKESFPDTWVLPIIDLTGTNDNQCNSLLGCVVEAESPADVTNWLMREFNNHYGGNKSPITLTINSAWFLASDHNEQAFIDFLDQLAAMNDVYFVSHKQLLDWSKNPQPLGEYAPNTVEKTAECQSKTCPLLHGEETRYMKVCAANCPDEYPWVGNPLGETGEPTEPQPTEPEPTDPTPTETEPSEP